MKSHAILNDSIVYQTDAYRKTPEDVAKLFARDYFANPREVERMDGNSFMLVDGLATYTIRFVPGKRFESVDVYQVVRGEQ